MNLTGKRLSLGFDLHHCMNIAWTLVWCPSLCKVKKIGHTDLPQGS